MSQMQKTIIGKKYSLVLYTVLPGSYSINVCPVYVTNKQIFLMLPLEIIIYYVLYHQCSDSLYQPAWLLTSWKEPGYTKFDQSLTKQHTDSILRESLSAHFSLRIGDANIGTSSSSEHTLLYPFRTAPA